jgi:peptide deformylase
MILPIRLFGDPILRERAVEVEADSPELQQLIDDMIETMHAAPGIGLAATQVGRRERVFVVDLSRREFEEDEIDDGDERFAGPIVYINPTIVDESDVESEYDEGCLSIPDLNETVFRPEAIRIQYMDRHFQARDEEIDGMLARVIQHEYDHLEGVLFIDHIGALKRRLLRKRLREISKGNVPADYPVAIEH